MTKDEQSALLVIDMQNDLCRDPRRRAAVGSAIPAMHRLIDAFASNGQPVLYSCFQLPPDDEQFYRFGDRYCVAGTQGAEIIKELLPLRGPIITKTKHSAFFDTDLHDRLLSADVQSLYLVGLQTQICIMTTAADASFRGYRAIAVSDCVISSREEVKLEALQWIEKYVGEVQDSSGVVADLTHAAA